MPESGSSASSSAVKPNIPKLIFSAILFVYFIWIAFDPMQGSFLDLVDLPIHEAGHLLFAPLGQFLSVAGGSLFQVIMPVAFVVYFWKQEQFYSGAIVLFWVGQSLINVFVYANDAVVMQLVLLGGLTGSEGSFHDWNYLLTTLGMLDWTTEVAGLIRVTGTLTILAAAALSVYHSFESSGD